MGVTSSKEKRGEGSCSISTSRGGSTSEKDGLRHGRGRETKKNPFFTEEPTTPKEERKGAAPTKKANYFRVAHNKKKKSTLSGEGKGSCSLARRQGKEGGEQGDDFWDLDRDSEKKVPLLLKGGRKTARAERKRRGRRENARAGGLPGRKEPGRLRRLQKKDTAREKGGEGEEVAGPPSRLCYRGGEEKARSSRLKTTE